MASRCLCGAVFVTFDAINNHILSQGHLIQCSCDTLVGDHTALKNHLRDVEHSAETSFVKQKHRANALPTKRVLCNKKFQHITHLQQHVLDKHYICPVCEQVFIDQKGCSRHQCATDHCYCAEHGTAFESDADLKRHKRRVAHVGGFECIDCQRNFRSNIALDDHLNSIGHNRVVTLAAQAKQEAEMSAKKHARSEKINLHCEACDRKFKTLQAFQQHKNSLKHKPLSELKCPVSDLCTGTFTSPSALLFHLESGACKSGMDRNKLNAIVYGHDADRHITISTYSKHILDAVAAEKSSLSVAPDDSASNHVRPMSTWGSTTSAVDGGLSACTDDEIETSSTIGAQPSGSVIPDESDSAGSKTLTISSSDSLASGDTFIVTSANDDVSSMLDMGSLNISPSEPGASSGILTPTSTTMSEAGGVILTPPASLTSNALSDWAFLNSSRMPAPTPTSIAGSPQATDNLHCNFSGRWPCQMCAQTFRKKHDLIQHMDSIVHAPKIFRCPTSLPGLQGSNRPTLYFKTLSGLAQHVEAGSCKGGEDTLAFVVGIFEKQIQAKLGTSVKLLKG